MKRVNIRLLLVIGVMLFATLAVRGQTVQREPPPKENAPLKDTGLKKRTPEIIGNADLCFSGYDTTGPLATVDPDGDGCLMAQEWTFSVKNTGVVDAPSSVVQLTITNSVTKEKRVINKRITVLKPGQVANVTFKFSIVADSYRVKLDAKGEVKEVNKSNNEHLESCLGGRLKVPCKK